MEKMLQTAQTKPLDCKMRNTQGVPVLAGWACDRTDCRAYGNVCPFSW